MHIPCKYSNYLLLYKIKHEKLFLNLFSWSIIIFRNKLKTASESFFCFHSIGS